VGSVRIVKMEEVDSVNLVGCVAKSACGNIGIITQQKEVSYGWLYTGEDIHTGKTWQSCCPEVLAGSFEEYCAVMLCPLND
jgi:hypothetical protein